MQTRTALTIYFDASCALCNSEMQNIKRHDAGNALALIDCSASDFDDSPFVRQGITRDAMMNCLHAQHANGKWLKGTACRPHIFPDHALLFSVKPERCI